MSEASTDHGSILEKDDWAIVWSEEAGFRFYTVPCPNPDDEMPEMALTLGAVFMRLDSDPEFVAEMNQWFKDKQKQTS